MFFFFFLFLFIIIIIIISISMFFLFVFLSRLLLFLCFFAVLSTSPGFIVFFFGRAVFFVLGFGASQKPQSLILESRARRAGSCQVGFLWLCLIGEPPEHGGLTAMLIFDRGLFHEIMHAALAPCPRPPASHLPFEALFVSLIHAASFLFPLAMS